ncbi:hypothetical protein Tco_0908523 [Tanacetum coccineum]|uniref:Uncharacterized protein n=1 Tax=Tanacetum coccineum TaxID=301880 RepID=A0ABQ5CPI6_9ASTR
MFNTEVLDNDEVFVDVASSEKNEQSTKLDDSNAGEVVTCNTLILVSCQRKGRLVIGSQQEWGKKKDLKMVRSEKDFACMEEWDGNNELL